MTINDLQAFVYIYQLRSITKAAAKVHRSQPELSKRLHALENELNVQLVNTSNRRQIQITDSGKVVYQHALIILQQYQTMMQKLAISRRHLNQLIRIGIIPVAGQYQIATSVRDFNAQYPQLQVTLLENEGEDVIRALKHHRIDGAILRDTQTSQLSNVEYHKQTLTSDELVVVMGKNNPLSQRQVVTVNDLRNSQIASLPVGSGVYEPIVKIFQDADLTPNIYFQSTHIETLTGLIDHGDSVSILFRRSVEPFINDELVAKSLSPSFRSDLQFVYPINQGSYQIRQLQQYLVDHV